MELQSVLLFAFNPLDPIIVALHSGLDAINGVFHNYGWSLIVLALLVKLVFWPLNTMQFKSMMKMQSIAPKVKALQNRYKNDKVKLNEATMALYKESGANPAAGCLPILFQFPILISLYQAIVKDTKLFAAGSWLWIGSPFAQNSPFHILAANLGKPDYVLLVLYVASMYFSIRFTSPATDPQQAQQQRIMAFISPAMIGFFGFKYQWPSALILYWLSFNLFTMGQQFYLINRYHSNPAAIGPHPDDELPVASTPAKNGRAIATSAPVLDGAAPVKTNAGGSRAARRKRSSRR